MIRRLQWSGLLTRGLVACCLLSLPAPVLAGTIAPDLLKTYQAAPTSTTPRRVIVQFNQGGVNSLLVALLHGGSLLRDLPLIGSSLMSVPQKNLLSLAADSPVRCLSPDRPLSKASDYDVQTVGADQVWFATGY